ncbi:MAG: PIN domain-containing protein [Solirubrobacterales bacterium]
MLFVDTSFLYAALDRRDDRHEDAVAVLDEASGQGLLTTSHVLGESWTLTRRRLGHRAAVSLLEAVRQSRLYTVVTPGQRLEERAFEWLHGHDEREYSSVDAVSFVTMRDRSVDTALAFDADFEAAGFSTLRG